MARAIEVCFAVTFGLGGHSEHFYHENGDFVKHGCGTLTGYSTPETWKPHEFEYRNTVVLDERAMYEERPALALNLPMIGNVPDGRPSRFVRRREGFAESLVIGSLARQEDLFGLLAREATRNLRFIGLDYVSANDYASLVRPLGARVGRVEGGAIVWEDSKR